MTTILNDVFAATEARNGYTVVSEQHDVNQITIEEAAIQQALRGVAGVWDAAEYGISAERAAQMLEEANTPEARETVIRRLREMAIRRANLDTTGGRVAVLTVGNPAWHGLGVNVDRAVNSHDAIRLAGLNWKVEKISLQYLNPVTNQPETLSDKFAIVRLDTGAALGTVGKIYHPFQNDEGFEFLDSVIGEFGAHYETAGALYGGSRVWMQLRLPEQSFTINGCDEINPFVIFTNSHDGTAAANCYTTAHRVVCQNTLRLANQGTDDKFRMRHSGSLRQKVEAARQSLGLARKKVEQFRTDAEYLATVAMEPSGYFERVLDAVCDVTEAEAAKGADLLASVLKTTEAQRDIEKAKIEREIEKRKNLMEDILSRYESETNGIGGMRGTAWAALNAVTESADHGKLGGRQNGKGDEKASRRFESIIDGNADTAKQVAYEIVKEMAV